MMLTSAFSATILGKSLSARDGNFQCNFEKNTYKVASNIGLSTSAAIACRCSALGKPSTDREYLQSNVIESETSIVETLVKLDSTRYTTRQSIMLTAMRDMSGEGKVGQCQSPEGKCEYRGTHDGNGFTWSCF